MIPARWLRELAAHDRRVTATRMVAWLQGRRITAPKPPDAEPFTVRGFERAMHDGPVGRLVARAVARWWAVAGSREERVALAALRSAETAGVEVSAKALGIQRAAVVRSGLSALADLGIHGADQWIELVCRIPVGLLARWATRVLEQTPAPEAGTGLGAAMDTLSLPTLAGTFTRAKQTRVAGALLADMELAPTLVPGLTLIQDPLTGRTRSRAFPAGKGAAVVVARAAGLEAWLSHLHHLGRGLHWAMSEPGPAPAVRPMGYGAISGGFGLLLSRALTSPHALSSRGMPPKDAARVWWRLRAADLLVVRYLAALALTRPELQPDPWPTLHRALAMAWRVDPGSIGWTWPMPSPPDAAADRLLAWLLAAGAVERLTRLVGPGWMTTQAAGGILRGWMTHGQRMDVPALLELMGVDDPVAALVGWFTDLGEATPGVGRQRPT